MEKDVSFLRARGEEQKKIRRQQIVDAAASLYAEVGYDKVTFSKIGRKVSFTRLNLYNYFPCKEDIFLTTPRTLFREPRLTGTRSVLLGRRCCCATNG